MADGNLRQGKGTAGDDEWSAIIKRHSLIPHPTENGHWSGKLLYQSDRNYPTSPSVSGGDVVQFLYKEGEFSPWHRLNQSDIVWLHQKGGTFNINMIQNGLLISKPLNPEGIVTVPAGTWYCGQVVEGQSYAFASCIVIPGFHPDNCEFIEDSQLQSSVPANDYPRFSGFVRKQSS